MARCVVVGWLSGCGVGQVVVGWLSGCGIKCVAAVSNTHLSSVAARMYFPFGENLTKETGGLSSSMRVFRHCPDAVSQIRLQRAVNQYSRHLIHFTLLA